MTSVVLAKALYNNDSEADDELSFKKGDVVTVLETDYEGMEGWWLCSIGDKQGVAPGNRLQLISYGEVESGDPNEVYDTPGSASKTKYGDADYDIPKPHKELSHSEFQDYAVPKSPYEGGLAVPESQRYGFVLPSPRLLKPSDARNSNSSDGMISNEIYDAPSRWSSERSSDEFRFSGEISRESGPEEIYDVPSRNSMESDDGLATQQVNMALRVPDIPPKAWQSTISYNNNNSDLRNSQEIPRVPDIPPKASQSSISYLRNSQEILRVPDIPPKASQSNISYSNNSDLRDSQEILRVPDIPPKASQSSISYNNNSDWRDSQEFLRAPDIPPKLCQSSISYDDNNSDLQDEIYDSPASAALGITDVPTRASEDPSEIYDELPTSNDEKKLSVLLQSLSDGGDDYATIPDEVYDVPPATSADGNPTAPEEIYDVPPGELSHVSYESGHLAADGNNNPSMIPVDVGGDEVKRNSRVTPDEACYYVPPEAGGLYDNFEMSDMEKEFKMEEVKSKPGNEWKESGVKLRKENSSESDDYVDYQEIYGMGKEEPRIAKVDEKCIHSVLKRINMEKVRELRITRDVAMTNLDKLQQAVDVAVTKLLSFVTEDWRQPEVLELNIHGIREISGKVKVALRLLTEFGLGTLVNSRKLDDEGIYNKIKDSLEPLLTTYYAIKDGIQRLDETDWKSAYQMRDDDELDSIAKMAQGIPCDAYKLGAVISNISYLLFGKTDAQLHSGLVAYDVNGTKVFARSLSYSSPATAQKESMKGVGMKKIQSQPVGVRLPITSKIEKEAPTKDSQKPPPKDSKKLPPKFSQKPPPKVSPKPKRDKKQDGESGQVSFPANVSELTNNLLNQIEDMKTPSTGLRRQGSKKLSPKTVRRLCSIGLKDDDKNGKIFEDVSSIPPKPSRLCSSSSMENEKMGPHPVKSNGESSSNDTEKSSASVNIKAAQFQEPRRGNEDSQNFERLNSFVEKMDSHVVILKESIKRFGESVREGQIPKVFVAHSKFIVLSAHKLLYIGDSASRSLMDGRTKEQITEVTNSLSEIINDFVENIKVAARQFPNENSMNVMIKSAAKVTEKALELYRVVQVYAGS